MKFETVASLRRFFEQELMTAAYRRESDVVVIGDIASDDLLYIANEVLMRFFSGDELRSHFFDQPIYHVWMAIRNEAPSLIFERAGAYLLFRVGWAPSSFRRVPKRHYIEAGELVYAVLCNRFKRESALNARFYALSQNFIVLATLITEVIHRKQLGPMSLTELWFEARNHMLEKIAQQ